MRGAGTGALWAGAALALLSASRAPAGNCLPLDEAARLRLTSYADGLYHDFARAPLRITRETLDPATCYMQLSFGTSPPAAPFRRVLYLTPDRRFLTSAPFDLEGKTGEAEAGIARTLDTYLKQWRTPVEGPAEAKVRIVAFLDYESEESRLMDSALRDQVLPERKGLVSVAYVNFPAEGGGWSEPAAQIGACAAEQGAAAFHTVHEYLFANQDQIDGENLLPGIEAFVKSAGGVDAAALARCARERGRNDAVRAGVKTGVAVGVVSAPTLFINGYRWWGTVGGLGEMLKAIDRLAGEKK